MPAFCDLNSAEIRSVSFSFVCHPQSQLIGREAGMKATDEQVWVVVPADNEAAVISTTLGDLLKRKPY